MVRPKSCNNNKLSYITVPSPSQFEIITSVTSSQHDPKQPLLISPKPNFKNTIKCLQNPRLWFLLLFAFTFLGMLKLGYYNVDPLNPISAAPCFQTVQMLQPQQMGLTIGEESGVGSKSISMIESKGEEGQEVSEFWEQPNGLGYRPCLEFTEDYRRSSEGVVKDRTKYLLVVVSGGLNQQRNQIVDAVVIARILGAALVVPILQVNVIWGDESEFSDIFDLEHFKRVLADDVHIVSSLPSTHLMSRPVEEKRTPPNVSPRWIRERYLKRLKRDGVLLLRGLDSRLSKDLPSDLQKLRCKVAFRALRFSPPILELGNKLTQRMRSKGPYIALHLRMEKDVWVRTGCLPGLSHKYDEIIRSERKLRPELLTGRSNMTSHDRKLAGLCPLNALDVTRLLKALGAPRNAKIYWAGGSPFGGREALAPLTREFPYFYNKEDLALSGELEPFSNKASLLAALDYIVSEDSDVFMPSHGGNMGHAIQGHRAYAGHKKYITPNKREMLPYFLNASLPENEFNRIIRELHRESLGQPDLRRSKMGRDVTKYPIPDCMCSSIVNRKSTT
ncbi:hypothetical protein GIB67_040219 [Kingdonia uniflora]|uniref:O-fucosyltransferase family protein n=1 Tax=Kingdonia uniflora TaxID=39325 RepID=A0A7J7MUX1_9MAGN|nr:hypothetical protein GIB67_040219 [Kingdonia uniflora]